MDPVRAVVSLMALALLGGCAGDSIRPLDDKSYTLLGSGAVEVIYVDPTPVLIMDVDHDPSTGLFFTVMFGPVVGAVAGGVSHNADQNQADYQLEQHRAALNQLRLNDVLFYNFQSLAAQTPALARAKFTRLAVQDDRAQYQLAASSQAQTIVVLRPKLAISTLGDELVAAVDVKLFMKDGARRTGMLAAGTARLNPRHGDTTLCDLGCLNHWFASDGAPLQDGLDRTLQDLDQQLTVYFHAQ